MFGKGDPNLLLGYIVGSDRSYRTLFQAYRQHLQKGAGYAGWGVLTSLTPRTPHEILEP